MKIVKPTTMDDHDDDGSDRGSSDAHNENSGPKFKSCERSAWMLRAVPNYAPAHAVEVNSSLSEHVRTYGGVHAMQEAAWLLWVQAKNHERGVAHGCIGLRMPLKRLENIHAPVILEVQPFSTRTKEISSWRSGEGFGV